MTTCVRGGWEGTFPGERANACRCVRTETRRRLRYRIVSWITQAMLPTLLGAMVRRSLVFRGRYICIIQSWNMVVTGIYAFLSRPTVAAIHRPSRDALHMPFFFHARGKSQSSPCKEYEFFTKRQAPLRRTLTAFLSSSPPKNQNN